MPDARLRVLTVIGSLNKDSVTSLVLKAVASKLRHEGCAVDLLDFKREPLPLFNPDSSYRARNYRKLRNRVELADVLLLGTPDYHGSVSSVMKNFLDHFWMEFTGKLFATIVSSHEKGLTVTDQLRTIARQCYAWSLPYAVSVSERDDVKNRRILSEALKQRLEMFARDIQVYGHVIAAQRRRDLSGTDVCFMARLRG